MSSPLPYAPVIIKLMKDAIYSDDPDWQDLQTYLTPIQEYFSKIGLQVRNYRTDGFAYLEQPEPEPDDTVKALPRLTKRQPLSFNVTLLCVLLREELRNFDVSGETGHLVVNIEKIRDYLQPYLEDKNNEETFRKNVESITRKVVELGFLKDLSSQEYEVRPILKAKINAEMLENLKQKLENYANSITP